MRVRTVLGTFLTIVGLCVVLYGVGGALHRFVGMYAEVLRDPLEGDDDQGRAVSDAMMRYVVIGALGVPPLLLGSILLKISMFQKLRRAAGGKEWKSGPRTAKEIDQVRRSRRNPP